MKGGLLGLSGPKEKDDPMADAEVAAMDAFLSAVKDGDAKGASDALKMHYETCGMYSGKAED